MVGLLSAGGTCRYRAGTVPCPGDTSTIRMDRVLQDLDYRELPIFFKTPSSHRHIELWNAFTPKRCEQTCSQSIGPAVSAFAVPNSLLKYYLHCSLLNILFDTLCCLSGAEFQTP